MAAAGARSSKIAAKVTKSNGEHPTPRAVNQTVAKAKTCMKWREYCVIAQLMGRPHWNHTGATREPHKINEGTAWEPGGTHTGSNGSHRLGFP